jgi:putative addiction module killer protein/probable addiction module antidote protein
MATVRQTAEFSGWLHRLADANAAARIIARIRRLELGNPGDAKSISRGVMEMRIDYGSGYRVYYVHRGRDIVVLLCGGDKSTQRDDIKRSRACGEFVMAKMSKFDAAEYLDSEERQVAYITAALETGDADFVRDALGLVARARGIGEIAKNSGLNRESLYKAFGESGNPELRTVLRVLQAMGIALSARPVPARITRKRRVA